MRRALLLLALVVTVAQTQGPTLVLGGLCLHAQQIVSAQGGPPMPPPGNPEHQEPAPGSSCHTPDQRRPDAAHECACHRTCVEGTDNEGNPDGSLHEVEDRVNCRANCYRSRCNCSSPCP